MTLRTAGELQLEQHGKDNGGRYAALSYQIVHRYRARSQQFQNCLLKVLRFVGT